MTAYVWILILNVFSASFSFCMQREPIVKTNLIDQRLSFLFADIFPALHVGGVPTLRHNKHYLLHANYLYNKYLRAKNLNDKNNNYRDLMIARIVAIFSAFKFFEDEAIYISDLYPKLPWGLQTDYDVKFFIRAEKEFLHTIDWKLEPEENPAFVETEPETELNFFTYSEPPPHDVRWMTTYKNLGFGPIDELDIVYFPSKDPRHLAHVVTMSPSEVARYNLVQLPDAEIITTTRLEKALQLHAWSVVSDMLDELSSPIPRDVLDRILEKAVRYGDQFKSNADRIDLVKRVIDLGANYLEMRWHENQKNILHMSFEQSYFSWLLELPKVEILFSHTCAVAIRAFPEIAETIKCTPWLLARLYDHHSVMLALAGKGGRVFDSSSWDAMRLFKLLRKFPTTRNSLPFATASRFAIFDPPESD